MSATANLYELVVYDPEFSNTVYGSNDYLYLTLSFIVIPILILFIFYKVIDPLPVKFWKWLLTVFVCFVVIFGFNYYWLSSNSMYSHLLNQDISTMTAFSFTLQLSFWSVLFSIIPILLFSWIYSRTISINNAKNPF